MVTPRRQCAQVPSLIENGEMTKSPAFSVLTAAPVSSTTPTNSWPIGCGSAGGRAPRYVHRSEPQTQAATTRTTASVGSWIAGSGRSSQRTSRVPYHMAACMRPTLPAPGRGDRQPLFRGAARQVSDLWRTIVGVTTTIHQRIAQELGVREGQVTAAVDLLDGGATVPFIARYRKEVTGTLDDQQLRTLEERLGYLRELEDRRAAVLESIRSQGKLDDALEAQILGAESKARLEDIYLPFKPKRRTRAQIAREAGLEPLADLLVADATRDPKAEAAAYVDADKGVADVAAALDGARAILVERFAEDPDLIGELRERMWTKGRLIAKVRDGKQTDGAKFADYFDFAEPFTKLPSHRILAMFRGEKEDVLDLTMEPEEGAEDGAPSSFEASVAGRFAISDHGRAGDRWLLDTVRWAWRTRILIHLGADLRVRLWQAAEEEAVRVFAANLRDLLLAAPAGTRATMGLDPGFRTGVKVAVVDGTGKCVATSTIYPHVPQNKWDQSLHTLATLAREHNVDLVAIGNGTASRETDRLAADLIKLHPGLGLTKVMVSEAGASVYSASAYASQELPGMDVSLRGAVSIARRLQDPLAELVKIDPRSIGVGQYQHDLSEMKLSKSLDAVVEDCVNAVGVDVNTASAPLLTRSPASARAWRRTSCCTATPTARSGTARRSRRSPGSAPRRSSSAPASCASPVATTRWTPPACTPSPTRWSARSWRRPAATSRR